MASAGNGCDPKSAEGMIYTGKMWVSIAAGAACGLYGVYEWGFLDAPNALIGAAIGTIGTYLAIDLLECRICASADTSGQTVFCMIGNVVRDAGETIMYAFAHIANAIIPGSGTAAVAELAKLGAGDPLLGMVELYYIVTLGPFVWPLFLAVGVVDFFIDPGKCFHDALHGTDFFTKDIPCVGKTLTGFSAFSSIFRNTFGRFL